MRTSGASVVWSSAWMGVDRIGWPMASFSSGCMVLARPLTAALDLRIGEVVPRPGAELAQVVSAIYVLDIRQLVLGIVGWIAPNPSGMEPPIGQGLDWSRTSRSI